MSKSKAIPVVKATVSAVNVLFKSKGIELPWEVWCIDTRRGYHEYQTNCSTKLLATEEASELIRNGERGVVLVHTVIPPMPY